MKIRIIGPVGSGKTTLAKQLSSKYGIPVTSLDELNWTHTENGDVHRTPEERQALLDEVLAQKDWIIEGVQYWYGQASFADADVIYFKDVSHVRNLYYLVKRYGQTKLKSGPEQYGNLRNFLKWETNYRTRERQEILALLAPHMGKVKKLSK